MENYYRSSRFILGDEEGVLARFLAADEFGLGLVPREYVKNVELRVSAVGRDRGSFRGYMYGVVKTGEGLRGQLDGLFGLRAGARIWVRYLVDVEGEGDKGEQGEKGSDVLLERIEKVRAGGYDVKYVVTRMGVVGLEEALSWELGDMQG